MNWLYSSLHTLCISLAVFCSSDSIAGSETQWRFVRDGVLHIRQSEPATSTAPINIAWRAAWIPNSQRETLYWLDKDGSLLERVVIEKNNNSGTALLETPLHAGDYYLEIPGAGYRFYQIGHSKKQTAVFEPAKVHQSASIEKGVKLYFVVPPNKPFSINGKHYGGIEGLALKSMSDGSKHKLKLRKSKEYSDFQTLKVAAKNKSQVWQLSFIGSGKISFWLDGVPNLFAQKPGDYFIPEWKTGTTTVAIKENPVGNSPSLGAALPHIKIPKYTHEILKSLHLTSSNYYYYDNLLRKNLSTDLEFMKTYQSILGLEEGITIRAETGRKAVVKDRAESTRLLEGYLKKHHEQGTLQKTFIAIADEPNLNYDSKSSFIEDYIKIADSIKKHPDSNIAKTRFAAPQSSRFINGPTRTGSEQRIGIDWLKAMLDKRPDLIDAISWHEWLVRDLIATEWYNYSISQADQLRQKYPNADKTLKPLIISQTNISSGKSLSPYEQDSFFAALWWASVVCQASLSGQLEQLVWFKAADDGEYNKGMIAQKGSQLTLKPAGTAQTFIGDKLLPRVLDLDNRSIELDILATSSKDNSEVKVLGVNKSQRDYAFKISAQWLAKYKVTLFEGLNQQKQFEFSNNEIEQLQKGEQIIIPAATIFSIHYQKQP